jgi:hypothetical protein
MIERRGVTELAWDEIERVEVGRFRRNGRLLHNVVIHRAGAPPVEYLHDFWQSVGGDAQAFISLLRRNVDDVSGD